MQSIQPSKRRQTIRRISIGGRFLDEVQTQIESGLRGQFRSYVSAPVERHSLSEDEEGVTVKLPALTALQLYQDGTLSADAHKAVELTAAGRALGAYFLHWMRGVADTEIGSPIVLRFGRQPANREPTYDASAWLETVTPLALYAKGEWDPADEYWGEPGEPVEDRAKAIIKRGKRPMFEMEQVLPGADPDDFDSDPILQANDLKARGQKARAKKLLERLVMRDVRCLDAHSHLGNLAFDTDVRTALSHYERGMLIGQLSLGEAFDGVLPWGMVDNRPFLRCLNGVGICLWRLGRFEEAESVFLRMLWMCPSDNMGVRMLLPAVQAETAWSPDP
jgi:tetratricopeptide (TPR) repeat protein